MAQTTEHRIDVQGTLHRWLERGEGFPVVLVHGIPTSPELWRHVMPLVDGARLLAWEMVGYGRSWAAGEGRDISVAAQGHHLLAWMDTVGIDRAVLAGHDLGGGVVQVAATSAPDRCAGLMITNGIAYDSWPVAPIKAVARTGPLIRRTPRALRRLQLPLFLALGHDDRSRVRESADIHWAGYDHDRGGDVLVRQASSLRTEDTLRAAPLLPTLDVPAAIVWGAADQFQRLKYGRRLAQDLGAPIDEIEGGKHFTPEDHPERVAAGIRRVLEQAA